MRLEWLKIGWVAVFLAFLPGGAGAVLAQGLSAREGMSLEALFARDTPLDGSFDRATIPTYDPQSLEGEPIDLVQGLQDLNSDRLPNARSGDDSSDQSSVPSGTTPESRVMSDEASAGSALYAQKCSRCHQLFPPATYSATSWPGIVRSMKQQAGISESEVSIISGYLTQAAKAARSAKGKGLAKGALGPNISGYLYSEFFRTESKQKNWDIHYLNVSVGGWANEKIRYFGEFEFEHGGRDDNAFVEQAFIDYWVSELFAIKLGAILTPFNRFDDFHAPLPNYTITRPQVSREIGVSAWKEVGIDLHGYYNFEDLTVKYDAYAINGLGSGANLRGSRQYRDNNEDMAVGGRVSLVLFDKIEWGGSIYSGDWDDDMTLNLTMSGTHFLWASPWAEIYGEYANVRSENPVGTDDGRMHGYFIQASRLFFDKFRTTARYGKLDYLDPGNALGRDASKGNKDVRELLFVLGYYPTPNVVFKFEYQILNEGARVANVENNQFGFQAAVRW